ncbi:hypothetical protein BH24ACT18_BH24ACT18_07240 [soil metagenome]
MFDSIRLRLTLGYVGILALILLLFGGVLVLGFRDATVRQHDDLLIKEARAWAATAARDGAGNHDDGVGRVRSGPTHTGGKRTVQGRHGPVTGAPGRGRRPPDRR